MSKKVIILNGSPRKNWNTYKMCESFANGVKESGAKAEIINLYDIDFKGCRSCFACKLKDGKNFGRCAYPDGLTPILDKIAQGDGGIAPLAGSGSGAYSLESGCGSECLSACLRGRSKASATTARPACLSMKSAGTSAPPLSPACAPQRGTFSLRRSTTAFRRTAHSGWHQTA